MEEREAIVVCGAPLSVCPRRRGFTLIELMITVSISAMLLGMVAMVMQRMKSNKQLDATANELKAALVYGRQIAFTNNGTVFSVTTNSGTTYYTVTTVLNAIVVDKTYIPSGVTLTYSSGMSPLTFSPNGVASAGGTLTLTSSTGRTAVITIVQALGTATMTIQ